MMSIRHLIHDPDLALAILSRWDHDPPERSFFKRFRISANAVYPFTRGGRLHFLRFAPETETSAEKIIGELELITHLVAHGYPANRPVVSRAGSLLETVVAPSVRYLAVVFDGVPGAALEPSAMSASDFRGWGRSLGTLYRLSTVGWTGGASAPG